MITKLTLNQFKSFHHAELRLDPFTMLVGANASGKSNLCDALRFLHGIGHGYTLPEIIGGVYRNGKEVWSGIRGTIQSLAALGSPDFTLEAEMIVSHDQHPITVKYLIQVAPGSNGSAPWICREELSVVGESHPIFATNRMDNGTIIREIIPTRESCSTDEQTPPYYLSALQPVLSQWEAVTTGSAFATHIARSCLHHLRQIRFFDFMPNGMRQPAAPGQTILSDQGENLSSVLQFLCHDSHQKTLLLSWLEHLTPMDASDLRFQVDATGKVVLVLVESDGRETVAFSASDGTLRFLAYLAALLSHDSPHCYVFEEVEHGIHPTRLYLLLELMQRRALQQQCQIIATTHSPQALLTIRPPALDSLWLTYRIEGTTDTRLIRIVDLPDARRLIDAQDIGRLHETGWFEDAADFVARQEIEEPV